MKTRRTWVGLGWAAWALCAGDAPAIWMREGVPNWLPPVAPGEAAPFPDWLPADVRGGAAAGTTNVLAMEARWLFPPPWGRPGLVEVAYSNRTGRTFEAANTGSPYAGGGVLCFALTGTGREPLGGIPPFDLSIPDLREFGTGEVWRTVFRLPPATLAAAAGSQGLALAYAGRQERHEVVYWADCAPLPVPSAAQEPGAAGTNEWRSLAAYWATNGIPYGPAGLRDVLRDYPEFAPYFPGVVLDATLPEAFRIAFAERMPMVDAWEPGVLAAVTNAPVKDAPLVLAMLKVLRRSGGPSPEEQAARRAINPLLYAMSQDAQNPLPFRLHAAHTFPMHIPIDEFNLRTEPHFKLLAADTIRQHRGGSYYEADRVQLRAGLTALSTDMTPFVAGPLAGKYPENATVGQVASIILADLEAKWAAEAPRQP